MDGPEGKPKQTKMLNQEEPDKTRVKKGNGSKHGKKTSRGTDETEGKQLPLPIGETSKEIVNPPETGGKQLELSIEETGKTIVNPPNPPNFWCTNRDCPYERAGNPAESADNPPAATYDNNPRSVV